jgi:hypothetical protein
VLVQLLRDSFRIPALTARTTVIHHEALKHYDTTRRLRFVVQSKYVDERSHAWHDVECAAGWRSAV